MAWLNINWQLNAWRFNERDDEEGLQFAVVTIDPDRRRVGVETYLTGDMSRLGRQVMGGRIQVPAFRISGRGWFGIPDSRKPFLGLVVRAIEYDNSSTRNRDADYADFGNAIRQGVQRVVDDGRTPTSRELLNFANSVRLRDRRWRDDDDLIGTLAYAYPEFGDPVDVTYHTDTRLANSDPHYLRYLQGGRISGEDAIWDLSTWPMILTGNPDDAGDEYATQERGGWWLFTRPGMR